MKKPWKKPLNKRFNFKSIKARILFGFSLVILFVLILGVSSAFSIQQINSNSKKIVDEQLPLLIAGENLVIASSDSIVAVRGYMMQNGHVYYKDMFNQQVEKITLNADKIKKLGASEELLNIVEQHLEWIGLIETEVLAQFNKGNTEVAFQNLTTNSTRINIIQQDYNKLITSQENLIMEQGHNNITSGETTLKVITVLSILIIVLSLVVSIFTSQKVASPIRTVMERMKIIADGDLSKDALVTKSRDEVGQLVIATNEMTHNMRELIKKINSVSETVSSHSGELTQSANEVMLGTEQITSTMQELASASETQANNSTELSSLMGEFTGSVKDASEKGEFIRHSSSDVLQKTMEGSQLMQSSTQQMRKIDEIVRESVKKVNDLDTQSQKISRLVVVIKDIAEQTNLLALNAAIEAARAGEQGRGFAVVADEVRKLAEQVAVSVNDITGIVANIQSGFSMVNDSLREGYREVEKGTEQIQTTDKTFNNIYESIAEMASNIVLITDNLKDISKNSQDMSNSIQEIAAISEESAAGVEETSAAAQQTSSSMDEVARSSNDLAQLAEELNNLIRQFRL